MALDIEEKQLLKKILLRLSEAAHHELRVASPSERKTKIEELEADVLRLCDVQLIEECSCPGPATIVSYLRCGRCGRPVPAGKALLPVQP